MKAVMLEVPAGLVEARRRAGADRRDECWEGVLHMVPPPSRHHQDLARDLFVVLLPLARARGLLAYYETGVFRPGTVDDYRVPDQVYARPDQATDRGIDGGAPLVVEIRSPGDETLEKLQWYASVGVGEVLTVHPEKRAAELFARRGQAMTPVPAGADGLLVEALGVAADTVEGPRLRLRWQGGSAEV